MKKQTYDLEERLLIKKPELLNDILEETEIAVECSVLDICFSFDVRCSMFDVHLSKQFRSERLLFSYGRYSFSHIKFHNRDLLIH